MKIRKKTIYRVWLVSQGEIELNGGNHRFTLAIEGAKNEQAAGRKATYIAWKKFKKILCNVRIDAIAAETVWY